MSTQIDYLDRDALLALDLHPADVDLLLADTPLAGAGSEPVLESDRLGDLLVLLQMEGRDQR